jgi:hypothetical protein
MFNWSQLSTEERKIALAVIGGERDPDLIIAPDGAPYLYRWHIFRTPLASVYFHIQVADDPERPLHDHPWDNTSVILTGGYREILHAFPGQPDKDRTITFTRRPGQVIHRKAEWSHRLLMGGQTRTLTAFSTGPKRKVWGFWYPHGFVDYRAVTRLSDDGTTSTHAGVKNDTP